jgi:hypothetical protein
VQLVVLGPKSFCTVEADAGGVQVYTYDGRLACQVRHSINM